VLIERSNSRTNSTRKLLWFEVTKMLIAVLKNKFTVSFIVFFGTLLFRILGSCFCKSKHMILSMAAKISWRRYGTIITSLSPYVLSTYTARTRIQTLILEVIFGTAGVPAGVAQPASYVMEPLSDN